MEENRKNYFILFKNIKESEGSFFSTIYDSKEKDTIWHRAVWKAGSGRTQVNMTFYASNRLADLENEKGLFAFQQKKISDVSDTLLHDVCGRYLLILVAWKGACTNMELRLEFPRKTWLEYLPEIYGQNSFLERFLCIFQSLYEDFGEEVEASLINHCPQVCDGSYLDQLAEWMDLRKPYLWKEEQLRYLLSHIMEFYELRGTPESIRSITALYTGERPVLVEYYDVEDEREGRWGSRERSECIRHLYGDDPYRYTLLVKEEHLPEPAHYKTLQKIAEDYTPAHMECRIVILRPYLLLNAHSYMGINSKLQRWNHQIRR